MSTATSQQNPPDELGQIILFLETAQEIEKNDITNDEALLVAYHCRQQAVEMSGMLSEEKILPLNDILIDVVDRIEKDSELDSLFSKSEVIEFCRMYAEKMLDEAERDNKKIYHERAFVCYEILLNLYNEFEKEDEGIKDSNYQNNRKIDEEKRNVCAQKIFGQSSDAEEDTPKQEEPTTQNVSPVEQSVHKKSNDLENKYSGRAEEEAATTAVVISCHDVVVDDIKNEKKTGVIATTKYDDSNDCKPSGKKEQVLSHSVAQFKQNYLPTASAIITTTHHQEPLPHSSHHQQQKHQEKEEEEEQEYTQAAPKNLEEQAIHELKRQGFTNGLIDSLRSNSLKFPIRFWVVDNSGSMNEADGHLVVHEGGEKSGSVKNRVDLVDCTRWVEIKECVNYHSKMSAIFSAPTVFRLLNEPGGENPQEFSIGVSSCPKKSKHDPKTIETLLNTIHPSGVTPLTSHIRNIHHRISQIASSLRRDGKRAVVVLATDGLPTDDRGRSSESIRKEFVESMRMLEPLPVWIVIRLCTDDEDVVNFFNDLDDDLELSMDVLDDYVGEAQEVYEQNRWLNYALPLHRIRELGFCERVLDLIDERTLTKDEVFEFCVLLFGVDNMKGVANPSLDWSGFVRKVKMLLKREKDQWNPIKKKVLPWIDLKELSRAYDPSSKSSRSLFSRRAKK